MALHITRDNFDQEITASKLPIVIDAYATWCPPCQQIAPHFDALEKELGAQFKFAKLNVDEARDIGIKYGITSIPTFIFIKNNVVVGKETGAMQKEVLRDKILHYLQ